MFDAEPIAPRPWTEADDLQLREYYAAGWAFPVIAATLGRTKNSTVHRAIRIGIHVCTPRPAATWRAPPKAKPSKVSKFFSFAPIPTKTPKATSFKARPGAWDALPGVEPVHIADLASQHCRWPVGEAEDLMHCGALIARKNYCCDHFALSYTRG